MGTTPTYALPYPELTDVANVPADMRELAEAVDTVIKGPHTDSGWVNVTVNAGFAISSGNTPQVRKIGNVVYARGGVAATGIAINAAHNVMVVPVGYRPLATANWRAGTNSGASEGSMFLNPANGTIDIRTNGTLATWYLMTASWLID